MTLPNNNDSLTINARFLDKFTDDKPTEQLSNIEFEEYESINAPETFLEVTEIDQATRL